MTKKFCRSPGDMFLGLVAVAPAIAIPLLFLAWVHRINSFTSDIASLDMSYNPLSTWMVGGMLAVCALYLIALIAERRMPASSTGSSSAAANRHCRWRDPGHRGKGSDQSVHHEGL